MPVSQPITEAVMPRAADEGRVRWFLMALLVVASCAAAGCGYQHKDLFPTDVRTVAVPIFENRSFYRGVEYDVTEALIKEIELRTPYKVVREGAADTVIRGTVWSVDQHRLSRQRTGGVPQELELRVVVNFEWTDQRTSKTLAGREGMAAVGRYVVSAPVGETLSVAQHQAAQRLAGQMVSAMAGQW